MSDGRPAANDEDRLPWLEPYREPTARRVKPAKAAKPKKARSGRGGMLALAGIVGLSAALAGGYWLGQRESSPAGPGERMAPVEQATTAPVPSPTSPMAVDPATPQLAEVGTPQVAPATPVVRRASSPKRRVVRRPKIHSAGVETANIEKVREDQGDPNPKPVWPKLPSPGPAGQVVQLGAFSNPDRAYVTYRARIARYPALGRMPRVIVPIAKGSNGRLLYVLRLGTASRVQSQQVCRNLRRSGDHCLVIG